MVISVFGSFVHACISTLLKLLVSVNEHLSSVSVTVLSAHLKVCLIFQLLNSLTDLIEILFEVNQTECWNAK